MTEVLRSDTRRKSAELRDRAHHLYQAGLGYKKSARLLNVDVHTVRDWFRSFRQGQTKYKKGGYWKKPYDEAFKQEIVERYRKREKPLVDLSRETGIPAVTIRRWSKEFAKQEKDL